MKFFISKNGEQKIMYRAFEKIFEVDENLEL